MYALIKVSDGECLFVCEYTGDILPVRYGDPDGMIKNSLKVMLLITGFILVAIVVGLFLIRDRKIDTDVTVKTTKVGLILIGDRNDASYNQAHYDAIMSIKDELNLEILCRDHVPEDESCRAVIGELTEEGCRIIIGASFGYGPYIREMAQEHPDVCFLHATGTEKMTNMASYMGRMYQARYLAGIVAGKRTESGKIGYVAAFPYSEVIRGLNAFTRGVKSVAPDAEVHVCYCESWGDDAAAEAATVKLLNAQSQIDVLTVHTDSLKPLLIADEKGIRSIGYNMDNAGKYPDTYLTACVWHWDTYYRKKILSVLQGKFYGENEWIGMEDGIVGLAELTGNVAPGTKEAVDEAKERFASRSFDVFYGPVMDNEGRLRVPEGESMSDDEMLNRFDWYVEGVIVEE